MFCPKCGAKNPDDAKFCGSCGQTIPQASVAIINNNDVNASGVQKVVGNVASQGVVTSNSAIPALKSKKNLIILGVIVVAILAVLTLVLTQCFGGNGIKAGPYSLKLGDSSVQSCIVNDDGTISLDYSGASFVFNCTKSGEQDDSSIYDITFKSVNGIELKYDSQGYITNLNEIYSLPWGGNSSSGYAKIGLQIMIPEGGTEGNVVGEWGFSATSQIANQETNYMVMFMNVDANNTFQMYGDTGSDFNVPGMSASQLIAADATSQTGYWNRVQNNVFTLATSLDYESSDTITVTMPS